MSRGSKEACDDDDVVVVGFCEVAILLSKDSSSLAVSIVDRVTCLIMKLMSVDKGGSSCLFQLLPNGSRSDVQPPRLYTRQFNLSRAIVDRADGMKPPIS